MPCAQQSLSQCLSGQQKLPHSASQVIVLLQVATISLRKEAQDLESAAMLMVSEEEELVQIESAAYHAPDGVNYFVPDVS